MLLADKRPVTSAQLTCRCFWMARLQINPEGGYRITKLEQVTYPAPVVWRCVSGPRCCAAVSCSQIMTSYAHKRRTIAGQYDPCAHHRHHCVLAFSRACSIGQILLNGNNVCMLVPGGDGPVAVPDDPQ